MHLLIAALLANIMLLIAKPKQFLQFQLFYLNTKKCIGVKLELLHFIQCYVSEEILKRLLYNFIFSEI
jgi:hypothetical protein